MKKVISVLLSLIILAGIGVSPVSSFATKAEITDIKYTPDIPLAKLELAEAQYVMENGSYYYDISNCIGNEDDVLTVFYDNGNSVDYTCITDGDSFDFVNENGESYDASSFSYYCSQEEEPWTVGNNNILIVEYMGKTCNLAVEVVHDSNWVKYGKRWKYRFYGNEFANSQFLYIEDQIFYFGEDAYMVTGWYEFEDGWRYFATSGDMFGYGWHRINGSWYFFGEDGLMLTSWQKIDGKWYYFNASGIMRTGWLLDNDKWYYFASSGEMLKGWVSIKNVWYHFDGSGAMQTGWSNIKNVWYYFNNSGAMQTGWQKIDGYWYYMNSSGAMHKGWLKLGDYWYYLNAAGSMRTANLNYKGKIYEFYKSGICKNP
ncbi:MAG: N-acetylmuramoyl-L-alanine amidase family protein [Eubacterium sp.]|nr:N-acetylmuramoyl-L-alanine amidase family protein [Eubacterium sp.]